LKFVAEGLELFEEAAENSSSWNHDQLDGTSHTDAVNRADYIVEKVPEYKKALQTAITKLEEEKKK
jgi:hypothetical protein